MIYKHWLKFISLDATELYQISEPVGFTSITSVLEQESKKYARDYSYGAIDKVEFVDAYTELADTIQIINPQGDTSEHLDYGLQWLLHIWRIKGFEAKVEYFISEVEIFHSLGMLDFTDKDLTDGYTFIKCKLIQNDKIADVKRRLDDKFNAFSDKDAKENTITPMPTFNYLKRATPLFQRSKWKYGLPNPKSFFLNPSSSFNFANAIEEQGIDNTLSYIQGASETDNFRYVRALNDLSQVKIKITNLDLEVFDLSPDSSSVSLKIRIGQDVDTAEVYNLETISTNGFFSNSFTLDIPFIQRTDYIWIYFRVEGGNMGLKFTSMDVEITAISTAIDQVIKASRYIDLIKQASKFTGGLPINAPLFDVGGLHYKNVVFSKKMVSQKIDTFNTTPKEVFESVNMLNCDFEINANVIDILHENDFYENVEIGVFNIAPDYNISQSFNDRFMLNKSRYSFDVYEQERTSVGSSNAFHTDAEFRLLNENVENVKEVKNKLVLDPFATQEMVNLEIDSPTTSTSEDDKIYFENYTELAPGSFGTFGSRLALQGVDGQLQILNQPSDATNNVINWLNLGFGVGSVIEVTYDGNTSEWNVVAINSTVLTLTPVVGFVSTFSEDAFVIIKYFYTDVAYQTRTNQGFTLVDGLDNANSISNLFYSIKRNMSYFGTQLATALMYAKKDIINAYFKNNPTLVTQLTTETTPVVENAPILYSSLPTPRLNATIHRLTLVAGFTEVIEYLERYKVNKGLIRCIDYNDKPIFLFPKKVEYNWYSGELQIDGEEKYSTEYLVLNYVDGLLYVNDLPYNLSGVSDWWKFSNDYIKLYDEKSRPLSNEYKFNFVNLNGIIYNSKEELVNALINL